VIVTRLYGISKWVVLTKYECVAKPFEDCILHSAFALAKLRICVIEPRIPEPYSLGGTGP